MNIEKEINEILIDKKNIDTVLEELREEKKFFNMKVHLIKAMNLAQSVEKLSTLDMCFNELIELSFSYDYDIGNILHINFSNSVLTCSHAGKLIGEINIKAYDLRDMPDSFLNNNFTQDCVIKIKVEPGCGEKVLDLLLSEEIKVAFNHSKMNCSLNKKEDNNKRTSLKI